MTIPTQCKRLAEGESRIAEVFKHPVCEKSSRYGRLSLLHLWGGWKIGCSASGLVGEPT
jgi:hypothetical protein